MKFIVATTALAYLANQVNAHGYLAQPAAYFPNGIETKYNALLTADCDPAFAGLKWDDSPEKNTATFTSSFPNSPYNTLRALMDTVATDCGNTALTGTSVDVSSLSSMKWQNDQEQMGFIDSHHGPCEAWIDDTRVFQSDDCRADYTAYPAEIPIDYSSCSGDCTFTFYWMALHEPNWQVYKQCAPIVNGSGGGQSMDAPAATKASTTATDAPTQTSTPSTTAPATESTAQTSDPATDAPASEYNENDSTPNTTSPTVSTTAPTSTNEESMTAPTMENPTSTSTSSCKSRRRRRMTANLRSEKYM